MANTASNTIEWLQVLAVAPSGSEIEAKALEKLGGVPDDKPMTPEKEAEPKSKKSSDEV